MFAPRRNLQHEQESHVAVIKVAFEGPGGKGCPYSNLLLEDLETWLFCLPMKKWPGRQKRGANWGRRFGCDVFEAYPKPETRFVSLEAEQLSDNKENSDNLSDISRTIASDIEGWGRRGSPCFVTRRCAIGTGLSLDPFTSLCHQCFQKGRLSLLCLTDLAVAQELFAHPSTSGTLDWFKHVRPYGHCVG